MNHTPGPWHIEDFMGTYEVWPKDEGQWHSPIARIYRESDARLIVEAPNLIAQLKALAEQIASCGLVVPPNVATLLATLSPADTRTQ